MTGIDCRLILTLIDSKIDNEISTAIFRILQESLTNIFQHASATRVSITLKQKAASFNLRIADNGKGISEEEIADPKSTAPCVGRP